MTLAVSQLDFGLLRDVSLTVSPGEVLCISGPSGSGKSRLLRALADLDPHCGTVCLNGRSQSQLFAHQWRAEVMMVPADSAWWDRTVGAHFPDTPAVQDLEALGLDPRVMDWEVARLSSGEKQRLALLRALARRPQALLLDEPTANLDPTTTRQTERWLLEQIRHRDLPTLWVAHDPEQIDRVANQHRVIRGDRLEPA